MRYFRFLCIFTLARLVCSAVYEDSINVEKTFLSCGEDSMLRCNAYCKVGVEYRAVRWYKVNKDFPHQLSGLLTRKLSPPNNNTRWYVGLQREVAFLEDSLDIFLPNVTSDDTGTYKCLLAAPVGEQNQEGLVHLSVEGCPEDKSIDQTKDIYLVTATVLLVVALMLFAICYATIRSILHQRHKKHIREPLLEPHTGKKDLTSNNALETHIGKKDIDSIYTLGSNWPRQASQSTTMKHVV